VPSKPPQKPRNISEAASVVIGKWIASLTLLLTAIPVGIIIIDRRDKERERLAIVECVLQIDQRCRANADR
jgi:hypothetical protein